MSVNTPLLTHLLRGATGALLLITAIAISATLPLVALALGVGSLIAFGGCPTCWLAGFCEVKCAKRGETEYSETAMPRSSDNATRYF